MTIDDILDFAFPITDRERRCAIDMSRLQHKRAELQKMIEAWKAGQEYFSPLVLKVDLSKIKKMINN